MSDNGEVGSEFTIGSGSGVVTTVLIGADPHLADKGRALRMLQQKAEEIALAIARETETQAELRREQAEAEHAQHKANEAIRTVEEAADKASRRLRDVVSRARTCSEALARMSREQVDVSAKIADEKAKL